MKNYWVVHEMMLAKDERDVQFEDAVAICTTKKLAEDTITRGLMHCKRIAWSQGLIPSIDWDYETAFSMMGVIRNTGVGTIVFEATLVAVIESSKDFEECCM